ncbi:flippase-like domain-containing protein [Weeksellaceae bacterium KMM 9724]|uniref:lysylphosphatidylglycerol synthase transmembrane domain-containing protein n=1 Tax=Profundicola chukchiensis TaxID=2961959 RepID=UPI0024400A4C|nr:lysylphosphatidylglycerol synthase transmembrane domain-containing protein [Profundicola chukchiensis]MDG4949910.1 flippase-like domain-containing protein [Profundicola chukchiensis]
MTKSAKTGLTVSISLLLALVLIWWAMRDVDFNQAWESIQRANYWWILLSFFLGVIAYALRSERWKLLLEPMGHQVSSSHSFYAICMNYFWNLIIPRSGEVARCTTLYTLDKTPVDQSFGTVISERVIDFLCLSFMGLLAVIFNFDLILKLFNEVLTLRQDGETESSFTGLFIIGGVALVGFLAIIIFWKKIKNLAIFPKIRNFIYGLRQGLKSIFQLKKSGLFIFYTILIWVFYYLMTYLVVFALPETSHLTMADGLYLLLVGGIGMIIPASGGIGAFHSAMRLGFIVLGLGSEIGVIFGFLVHTPHTLIALILGGISLVMMSIEKSSKKAKSA